VEHFGRIPILTAILLDSRENVRKMAHEELAKPIKDPAKAKLQEQDTFKQRFKPLLDTLRTVLQDEPYQAPTPRPAGTTAKIATPALSKEQLDRDILASTPYRQLQKERNALAADRDKLQTLNTKLATDLAGQTSRANTLISELVALQSQWRTSIAQGIADGLQHRLAPWLAPTESLANNLPASQNALERARHVLARQAQQDQRYGTRAQVTEELAQARSLLAALQTAQQEALRPMPQLADEIRALATHIATTEARLNQTSLKPQAPQLRALAQTLLTLHDIDVLQKHKKALYCLAIF
jgi:chromosome segregation ATPase